METERNISIDYFRLVLYLLVIPIHTQPLFAEDSIAGWFLSNGICRIAVPCFFIISGYFICAKIDDSKALKKYLLHLLTVYAVWSLIYLPTYYNTVEPRSLFTFALMGYYHLWYLPALITGILLLIIVRRFIKRDKLILISGGLLFIFGYYLEYNGLYYRFFCNGIFFGYPFVVLGYCIMKRNWLERFKGVKLYFLLIAGFSLLILETYISYTIDSYRNMLLPLYIFCPMLFLLILRNSKNAIDKWQTGKLSAGIYYIHILVITQIITLSENYNIYKLPLIMAVSILLTIFIALINKRIKIFL